MEANEDITEDNVDYQSDTGSDVSRAQLGAEDICHAVDCLFRVAVHLAKRLIKDDFSKATSIDVSMFEYSDLQYVHDKFPEAEGWFLKRVAKGLFKRRQYLKYRELRSAEIPKSSEEAPDFVEEGHEIDNKGKSVLLSTTETTFAETPEFPRPAPTDDSASVDSATTYSSMIGKASGMPRLPNDAIGGRAFQCPVCRRLKQLSAEQTGQEWLRHVFRDLKPYICTFRDCEASEELFESSHRWIEHEMRIHRRSWTCRGHCNEIFHTYDTFKAHISSEIPIINLEQLPTFVDMCASSLDAIADSECPLCRETIRGVEREKHIGRHMEGIALFALPQGARDDLEDSSGDIRGLLTSGPTQDNSAKPLRLSENSLGEMYKIHGYETSEFRVSRSCREEARGEDVSTSNTFDQGDGNLSISNTFDQGVGSLSISTLHPGVGNLSISNTFHNDVNDNIFSRSNRFWCQAQGCTDNKGFSRKRDLNRHIDAFHQEFKRFHCGCCMNASGTFSSSRKDHIKQHIRKKHIKNSEVQWCDVNNCDASIQLGFSSRRCLAEHVHGYHYDNANPALLALQRKFSFSSCGDFCFVAK